jgi:predicted RNA-binding Zn-ribbon protein involved in translation (DUF1610 family)
MTMAQTQLKQFPCSSCGSKLEFNPGVAQLKCPNCGHEEAVPDNLEGVEEQSYDDYLLLKKPEMSKLSDSAMEVSCPGCRASITFQPPDVAGKCPFCGTGIVGEGKSAHAVVTPGGILPCKITQKQARQKVRDWLKGGWLSRWFAPSGLWEMAQQEGVQGVYLPFWTYDAQTDSQYQGQRGEWYYLTESYTVYDDEGNSSTETRQVRYTNWYSVSGQIDRWFDDILIPASKQIPPEKLQQLEPWDLAHVLPYDPGYLAGFKAQRYQVPLENGLDLAKQRITTAVQSDAYEDIGGDEQQVNSISTAYSEVTYKHILLPIWLSAYRFGNKQYQVMVNAQTGQVLGERPYSKLKIGLAIGAAAVIVLGGIIWIASARSQRPTQRRIHHPARTQFRSAIPSTPPIGLPCRSNLG